MKYWNAIPIKVRVVLILLMVLVAALVLYKNWSKLTRLFKQDRGRGDQQADLTDGRKADMETLARRIYADIHSSVWTPRDHDAYNLAVQLNDNELEYLARFYETVLSEGTPLGQEVDDEIMSDTDADERIIARLKTLALY
jgi:hypothetical protein